MCKSKIKKIINKKIKKPNVHLNDRTKILMATNLIQLIIHPIHLIKSTNPIITFNHHFIPLAINKTKQKPPHCEIIILQTSSKEITYSISTKLLVFFYDAAKIFY